MKFKKENSCTKFIASLMLFLMMIVIGSCSNNNSHDDMKGMHGEKNENSMAHDTMDHNMEEMDNIKMENKSELETMHHNMKEMDTEKNKNKLGHETMHHTVEVKDKGKQKMNSINKSDTTFSPFKNSLKIASLVMPVNYRVVSSQKSVKPVQKTAVDEIKAQGYISIDERRNNKVSARISGRIEKLFINYNFQYVKKGEKIMEIYSPELNTVQEELLFLMKGNNTIDLANKAELKLLLLGMTPNQISDIKKAGSIFSRIDIYSPQNGYVFFKPSSGISIMNNSSKGSAESKMNGMRDVGNNSNKEGSGTGQIREGNYVNIGDVLFWVNDLDIVLAMTAIDNSHQQEVKAGANVTLVSELYKNDTIHATINFIEPIYQQNQKFIMTRIYLKNPRQKLKINSFIEATIYPEAATSNMVPYGSILFLGKRKIVWVLKEKTTGGNKVYEARDVLIGRIYNGMVEIKKGLNVNEEIAMNAGYLIDRESLIEPE